MLIEYVKSIKAKEFTATDGVKKFIAKIRADKHNAILEVFEKSALEQARIIDDKIKKGEKVGKLAGAPIIIKDNILYKGHIASAASKMLEKFVAPYNATIVNKMLAENAIILGRANMDEFAMGTTGENSAFGATQNAINPEHVAGGSSSGSAVAVALELCVAAIGTDTGGSVRCPAAYNGLYAIKPTYGTISRYGLIAFASSLDQAGPICKTARDTKLMFEVLHGKDENDGTTFDYVPATKDFDIKKLRIGRVDGIPYPDNYNKVFDFYKQKGATIVNIKIKNLDLSLPAYYIIAPAEVCSNLGRFDGVKYTSSLNDLVKTRTQFFGKEVKRRIQLGNYVLSSGYFDAYYGKARKIQSSLKREFARAYEKCDCIIIPVTTGEAPKLNSVTSNPMDMYLIDLFTVTANIVGVPAMTVPFDVGAQGLPIGFQIMGKPFDENTLFALAEVYNGK